MNYVEALTICIKARGKRGEAGGDDTLKHTAIDCLDTCLSKSLNDKIIVYSRKGGG